MVDQRNHNLNITQAEVLNLPRRDIGSTEHLKAKILEQTNGMAQTLALEEQVAVSKAHQRVWTRVWMPMALAASLVLAVVLWLPSSVYVTPLSSSVVDELLSNAELEFQDALLLQDELIFADL